MVGHFRIVYVNNFFLGSSLYKRSRGPMARRLTTTSIEIKRLQVRSLPRSFCPIFYILSGGLDVHWCSLCGLEPEEIIPTLGESTAAAMTQMFHYPLFFAYDEKLLMVRRFHLPMLTVSPAVLYKKLPNGQLDIGAPNMCETT